MRRYRFFMGYRIHHQQDLFVHSTVSLRSIKLRDYMGLVDGAERQKIFVLSHHQHHVFPSMPVNLPSKLRRPSNSVRSRIFTRLPMNRRYCSSV